MDLQNDLIESSKQKKQGGWRATVASLLVHGTIIGGIIAISATATQKVNAEVKKIPVYIAQGAAPPPPPPPPPPPAASSSTPQSAPHHSKPKVEPVHVEPQQTFVQPRIVPKETPKVQLPTTDTKDDGKDDESTDDTPQTQATGNAPGGVVGGVEGGVQGGTVGGEVGGQIGGVIGGVQGGVVGGKLGGEVGGTGSGTEGKGNGGDEAPPAPQAGPLRVGGDVKAPVAINREQPKYTEIARHARVSGIVIVEAIVNKNGEVEQVRVVKGLPMGLSEEAERAVKQWRFKPGTQNGNPVDVIFNLTVNFQLGDA
jgi:protein TonB